MSLFRRAIGKAASLLHGNENRLLGIDNTIRISKAVNSWLHRKRQREHQQAYLRGFQDLLDENGPLAGGLLPRNHIRDGWALDTSQTLPHLEQLLSEAGEVIAERAGQAPTVTNLSGFDKPYFFSLLRPGDLSRYPSFLNFALSSEVLATVAHCMGTIPIFSRTRPPGVRFMESNAAFDPTPGVIRDSQNFHLDIHDRPVIYVLVLLRDTPLEAGPWHFLPASSSDRASRLLGYQKWRQPYRVTDERMFQVADPGEVITFSHPKGAVLFIESSRCFHFGSRSATVPRFQMMYAYTTPCRGDLSELTWSGQEHPRLGFESRLRQMVLRR